MGEWGEGGCRVRLRRCLHRGWRGLIQSRFMIPRHRGGSLQGSHVEVGSWGTMVSIHQQLSNPTNLTAYSLSPISHYKIVSSISSLHPTSASFGSFSFSCSPSLHTSSEKLTASYTSARSHTITCRISSTSTPGSSQSTLLILSLRISSPRISSQPRWSMRISSSSHLHTRRSCGHCTRDCGIQVSF